jgi:peptidoglycan hydrolase-like protein with peptidoglycan-binding domain
MKKLFLFILLLLSLGFTVVAQTGSVTPKPAVSPSPKPKKVVFRATKDQVTAVQTKLKEANLYAGEITGKSNAAFKTAVKSWQKDNGLVANGSLNRATLEKMGIELTEKQMLIPVNPSHYAKPKEPKPEKPVTPKPTSTASTSDGPKRPAPFQADKDQIMALQTVLKNAKMFNGEADGTRTDELKEAVKKYQEANGLKVTGGINAETLTKAGIALTDKQKAQVAAQAAYDAAKNKQ